MSRDSKEDEKSRSQKTKHKPRRRRTEDQPTTYEEVMQIPPNKAGLIIGKGGWRVKDIKEKSGVKNISIQDDRVHLKGTEEQCANAKKIIDKILRGEDSPDERFWKKLDFIPQECIGGVIGRTREQLNDIEQKTGATLKVFKRTDSNSSIYIQGSQESQRKAIRKIKEIVYNMKRQTQSGKRPARLVHVDTTQLNLKQDFQLSVVPPPNACSSDEPIYELKQVEDAPRKDTHPGLTGTGKLKETLLKVLKKIHEEKEEERVRIDIWCHLGHAYIIEVDEEDLNENGGCFTLAEIKEKLEEEKSWQSVFKGGLEKIEVDCIEEQLKSREAKEEIRYDFTFYTPSCRYARVKVWLTKKDDAEQGGDEAASMSFSRAPFDVMTVSSHVLPDDQGESSQKPCFDMCSQTQQRMKADLLMLSKGCDYRLFIKTCPVGLVPRTPQEEEEDKVLESYLMGMKIEGDKLVLPPVSERPDGFDLFYQRRSLRRIYEYGMDGEQFTLLISKYQDKTVDPTETETSGFDEIALETDIHLHCKEWDRLLEEGNWEPEQIVAKLPTFFQFLRNVQGAVTPQVATSDDEH